MVIERGENRPKLIGIDISRIISREKVVSPTDWKCAACPGDIPKGETVYRVRGEVANPASIAGHPRAIDALIHIDCLSRFSI